MYIINISKVFRITLEKGVLQKKRKMILKIYKLQLKDGISGQTGNDSIIFHYIKQNKIKQKEKKKVNLYP